MPTHTPLDILFAGRPARAQLLDGSRVACFVRELPDRYLGLVLEHCENRSALIELCTYLEGDPAAAPHYPAFPQVLPPKGYRPVPAGWADNLTDDTLAQLGALAEKLNFSRAATKGEALIAAKQRIAPLYQATINQVIPLVQSMVASAMNTASGSTPNTRPSRAARTTPR